MGASDSSAAARLAALPVTGRWVPAAARTLLLGSIVGIARSSTRWWQLAALVVVALLDVLATNARPGIWWLIPAVILALFVGMSVYQVVAAWLLPSRMCWVDPKATIVLTARKNHVGYSAANFGAFPVGGERTGAFLTQLCDQADLAGWVITATAGNRALFTKLYQPLGFHQIAGKNNRPKLARLPMAGRSSPSTPPVPRTGRSLADPCGCG